MTIQITKDSSSNMTFVDGVQTTARELDEVVKGTFSAHASRHDAGGADVLALTISSTNTLTNKTLTSPLFTGTITGWISTGTFTYASATTITVASGAASIYQIGDKLRFKQTAGTWVYMYVESVADTVLTVTAGSDFTVANEAITEPAYSHAEKPLGFPQGFAYTPTGPTNTTLTGRFCVSGHFVKCNINGAVTGASDWTNLPTLPTPASASIIGNSTTTLSGVGSYTDAGVDEYNGKVFPSVWASDTTLRLYNSSGQLFSATRPITWANGDGWTAKFDYEI